MCAYSVLFIWSLCFVSDDGDPGWKKLLFFPLFSSSLSMSLAAAFAPSVCLVDVFLWHCGFLLLSLFCSRCCVFCVLFCGGCAWGVLCFLFGHCLPNVCRSPPGASAARIPFASPLICPVLLSCCLSSSSVMVVVCNFGSRACACLLGARVCSCDCVHGRVFATTCWSFVAMLSAFWLQAGIFGLVFHCFVGGRNGRSSSNAPSTCVGRGGGTTSFKPLSNATRRDFNLPKLLSRRSFVGSSVLLNFFVFFVLTILGRPRRRSSRVFLTNSRNSQALR